jgi:hypothetical protein
MRLPDFRVLALAAMMALPGCRSGRPATLSTAQLREVPLQVTFGGQTLVLESYLWRDFMPVAPKEGRPLAAVLRLRARGEPVSRAVEVDSAWVIWGDRVWATAPKADAQSGGDRELLARGGPRWPPGTEVEVVVRLRERNAYAFLRAPRQRIRRTD